MYELLFFYCCGIKTIKPLANGNKTLTRRTSNNQPINQSLTGVWIQSENFLWHEKGVYVSTSRFNALAGACRSEGAIKAEDTDRFSYHKSITRHILENFTSKKLMMSHTTWVDLHTHTHTICEDQTFHLSCEDPPPSPPKTIYLNESHGSYQWVWEIFVLEGKKEERDARC